MPAVKVKGKYETRAEWEREVKEMRKRGVRVEEISRITESTRSSISAFFAKRTRY